MSDEPASVAIRSLAALAVDFCGQEILLPLVKTSKETTTEFVDEVYDDFIESVREFCPTNASYFSVSGDHILRRAKLKTIFGRVFRQPYEEDSQWGYVHSNGVGYVFISLPVDVNIHRERHGQPEARSVKTAKKRIVPHVRSSPLCCPCTMDRVETWTSQVVRRDQRCEGLPAKAGGSDRHRINQIFLAGGGGAESTVRTHNAVY